MENNEIVISGEIGIYGFSDEFYVNFFENVGTYDSIFAQGLLFSDLLFQISNELEESLHWDTFVNFISFIKTEDINILAQEKKKVDSWDEDKGSPDDKRFIFELEYSKSKHNFYLESKGSWMDKDSLYFDLANVAIEMISFLGKKNIQNVSYYSYMADIANNVGNFLKSRDEKGKNPNGPSFMIVMLAYDNFLNDTTYM